MSHVLSPDDLPVPCRRVALRQGPECLHQRRSEPAASGDGFGGAARRASKEDGLQASVFESGIIHLWKYVNMY